VLEMTLPAKSAALYGEVAEARFQSLVATLGATGNVKIARD